MSDTEDKKETFDEFKDFDWSDENQEPSLNKLFDIVIANAAETSGWYSDKARKNRLWAMWLRSIAIVASTLGAGIPLVSKLFGDQYSPSGVPVELAAIVLSCGVAAILLDKFYGFSSSWIRFITTHLKIKRKIQTILFEWQLLRLNLAGKAFEKADLETLFSLCYRFHSEISDIVKEETQAWKQQFEHSLALIDERLNMKFKDLKEGTLVLTVSNGSECEEGWTANINGVVSKFSGAIGKVENLRAGSHKLVVSGKINNADVKSETMVSIDPGGVANVSVTLA